MRAEMQILYNTKTDLDGFFFLSSFIYHLLTVIC